MRSTRFSLALFTALLIGSVCAIPLQAQSRNERRSVQEVVKRIGRLPKVDLGVAPVISNYEVSQTTGAITPGTDPVGGFVCPSGIPLDDCTAVVTLPFTYTFYDQTYNSVNVSTNGNLQFVSNNPDYGQLDVCLPLGGFNQTIFAHWGDLTIRGENEGIFTSVTGSAPNRIFNIEWRASLIDDAPGSQNFEVRLYEGQARFDVILATVPGSGSDVTVGVQKGTGATYTEFSCHQNVLRNGMMLIFTGTANTSLFIAGRVTDPDGNPIAGVDVNLTGTPSGLVTTDGTGNYAFTGLTAGQTYSVAASQAGFSFFPQIRSFGAPNRAFSGNFIVNFIRTTPPNPGDVLISEFRFRGEGAATAVNEFVEILNNTNHGITVNVTDGSAGWLVRASEPSDPLDPNSISFTIPNGTTIPARGHYLAGNGSGYNLFSYGFADTFYNGDISDFGGVALFSTADPTLLNLAHRLDAVGFSAEPNTLYREGAGLTSPGANAGNYSFVRRLTSGAAQDTNNNAADFQFVSTNGGLFGGLQSTLGAPGPENTSSPIQRNAQMKASLIDPVAGMANAPNRVRSLTAVPNGDLGTLAIRRRFTNNTGQSVTRLRFRIVDITTLGPIVPGQAELRALNSAGSSVMITGGTSVQVRGLTVEQGTPTPTIPQPSGGGLNTSLAAGIITVAQPLAPGASVNVEFLLGVQAGGSFRFFVNVEALP